MRTADSSLPEDELHKARRRLVDMAIAMRRPEDAEAHLKILMNESPQDPELLDLDGQALVLNNKDEKACEQFQKAIEIAPTQVNTYVRLAIVLRSRLEKKTEADQVMKDMVSRKDKNGNVINAKSVDAFQKYAWWFLEQEKFDDALAQVKRVLELSPKDPRGLLDAGRCYLAKGEYGTAEKYLAEGIEADKKDRAMYKVMADVKNRLGRHKESLEVLQKGLANTKGTFGYADILWDVVNANISDRKFDDAEAGIKELRDLRFAHDVRYRTELVDFLEARLAVMKGDWNAAKAAFLKVLPRVTEDPGIRKLAYLYLSQCYHQEGDVEKQRVALSEAVQIDPYLGPARLALAEIYIARNDFEQAAEQYRTLLKASRPEVEAALSLARIMIMTRLREDKEKRDWGPVRQPARAGRAEAGPDPQPGRAQGGSAPGERQSQGGGDAPRRHDQ